MNTEQDHYSTEEKLDKLFQDGLNEFRKGEFFEAHEVWEELWKHHQIKDRRFIQGLIQLAASFYKIQVGNLRGARSLLKKSIEKFNDYQHRQRNIDVDKLKSELKKINDVMQQLSTTDEFSFSHVPVLD